jgi:hypothetical protein
MTDTIGAQLQEGILIYPMIPWYLSNRVNQAQREKGRGEAPEYREYEFIGEKHR